MPKRRHTLTTVIVLALQVFAGLTIPFGHQYGEHFLGSGEAQLRSHDCGDNERHQPPDDHRFCVRCVSLTNTFGSIEVTDVVPAYSSMRLPPGHQLPQISICLLTSNTQRGPPAPLL